jgi:hypothetical protein
VASLLAAALAACHRHASDADCAAIADHYVDLAARETPGASSMTAAQLAAVRDVERGLKRAVAPFRRVQDHCQDVTKAESSCATDARTTRDWEACFDER